MMKGPSSSARSSAIPRIPGARFSSRRTGNIRTRPWCCSATGSIRPADWQPRRPAPSIAPQTRRFTWTWRFFQEMSQRFAAAGDFAQAYVIAHEVGHHVQTLLGVSAKIQAARQQGRQMEGDGGLLVRQELQADCLAGVWANNAQKRLNWLEPGDIEEALNAANAIGDDRLQQQGQGRVVPGLVYPWYVGATGALVQNRFRPGPGWPVRYLCGEKSVNEEVVVSRYCSLAQRPRPPSTRSRNSAPGACC